MEKTIIIKIKVKMDKMTKEMEKELVKELIYSMLDNDEIKYKITKRKSK